MDPNKKIRIKNQVERKELQKRLNNFRKLVNGLAFIKDASIHNQKKVKQILSTLIGTKELTSFPTVRQALIVAKDQVMDNRRTMNAEDKFAANIQVAIDELSIEIDYMQDEIRWFVKEFWPKRVMDPIAEYKEKNS
jgi:hypothetical protein